MIDFVLFEFDEEKWEHWAMLIGVTYLVLHCLGWM